MTGICFLLQRNDFNSAAHRSLDKSRVLFNETHDFTSRRKGFRVVALVLIARQLDRPIGKLETERIPSFAAPTFAHAGSFEYDVLASSLTEKVAHRQAGMATTDNYCLYLFSFSIHKYF